jgi:hypothetical protein
LGKRKLEEDIMPRKSNRGGRNNNPSGRNQYSDWGVVDMVRERPIAAAAAAAGAAATGLFLWSKRAQISDQLSNLSEQVGQWTDGMRSGNGGDFETKAAPTATSRSGAGGASASNRRSTTRRQTPTSSPG